ncbi:diacylglycerol/lipid kinase family protein [Actinomycetota bacterium Odt1-20B]
MSPSFNSVLVVANPAAGGYRQDMLEDVLRLIAKSGAAVTPLMTGDPGHARTFARVAAAPGGPDALVALGGDGTARELMRGLVDGGRMSGPPEDRPPRPLLLVLPGGTANSMYREIWSDLPWRTALELALDKPRVRRLDLAGVAETGGLALVGASSGLAARTLAALRGGGPGPASARYEAATAEALDGFAPYPGRVLVDGVEVHRGPTVSVHVGGGRHRMGLFRPLPLSEIDDGLLDVCVAGAALPVPRLLELMRDGGQLGHEGVVHARGRRVTVERTDGRPLLFEYDGDLAAGDSAGYTLEVVPRALPVLAPPDDQAR